MSKRISTVKTDPRRRRYPRVGSHEELVRRAQALAPILRQTKPARNCGRPVLPGFSSRRAMGGVRPTCPVWSIF